jgi:RNA polymerase sigma-70 factor (ECF subfamily)
MFLGADGQAVSVILLDIAEGLVQTVRGISNPDKLRHLDPAAGVPWQIDRGS